MLDAGFEPRTVCRKVGESAVRTFDGETVLVPLASGIADVDSIFVMNAVGAAIWELVDGARSVTAISDALAERFDVSPEQALADAREFLGELAGARLVDVVQAPPR